MRILALDTALSACSAAIWDDGTVSAQEFLPIERGHAEALLPMVERVRAEAGLPYDSLDRLAVTVGPGAFVGIRVGLAAARGLAVALDLPVVGLTTFELLAAGAGFEGQPVSVAIDARNDQIYFQQFSDDLEPIAAPALIKVADGAEQLKQGDSILIGSGAAKIALALDNGCRAAVRIVHDILPDAAVSARLAAGRKCHKGTEIAPLYLRPPDARLPGASR